MAFATASVANDKTLRPESRLKGVNPTPTSEATRPGSDAAFVTSGSGLARRTTRSRSHGPGIAAEPDPRWPGARAVRPDRGDEALRRVAPWPRYMAGSRRRRAISARVPSRMSRRRHVQSTPSIRRWRKHTRGTVAGRGSEPVGTPRNAGAEFDGLGDHPTRVRFRGQVEVQLRPAARVVQPSSPAVKARWALLEEGVQPFRGVFRREAIDVIPFPLDLQAATQIPIG